MFPSKINSTTDLYSFDLTVQEERKGRGEVLEGMWRDQEGWIQIKEASRPETGAMRDGIVGVEVPSYRRWGQIFGDLEELRIHGVDFRDGKGQVEGRIITNSPTSSSDTDLSIEWSNGERWERVSSSDSHPTYRFLRVVFSQTLREEDQAFLSLNELSFIEGLGANQNHLNLYSGLFLL